MARLQDAWARLRSGERGGTFPPMIRSELAARIAAQNPHLYGKETEAVVDAILDRIAEALAAGDRVELRDFGVFTVRQKEARKGRDPRTGAAIEVGARAFVHFKPGRGMRARLNPVAAERPAEETQRRAS